MTSVVDVLRDRIYNPNFTFSKWVTKFANSKDYNKYARSATVYYDDCNALSDVKILATQREPTNIAMNRIYDEEELYNTFGWKRGAYEEFKYQNINIAIFSKTRFNLLLDHKIDINDENIPSDTANIISVIGYAFDNINQPDYINYSSKNKRIELIRKYTQVFNKIFFCAIDKKLSCVVLSKFGLGNFACYYEHNITEVWKTALVKSLSNYAPSLKKAGITEISCMGITSDMSISPEIKKLGFVSKPYGFIPDIMYTDLQLHKTLIVNAWDPWSFVGNGNYNDGSLDGRIGRRSALSVLCWPIANPLIRYVSVPDKLE